MIIDPSNIREHVENLRSNVGVWITIAIVKIENGGGKQALEKMEEMRKTITDITDNKTAKTGIFSQRLNW